MAPEREPSSSSQNSSEQRGLLYILLSAFAFLFGWSLSKLRTPNQDSSSSRHPQDSTCDTTQIRQNIPSAVHVIVDASPPTPTPNKERESREERQEGRDKKRFRVEIVVAVVLAIYTVVTGFMWWATKKAANAAKQSADAQVALYSPSIYTTSIFLIPKDYFKEQPERMAQRGAIPYGDYLHLVNDGRPVNATVVVEFENDGLTPALVYGFELEASITIEPRTPPSAPDILHMRSQDQPLPGITSHTRLFTGTVRPSQQQVLFFHIWDNHWWLSLSSEDIKAIHNKDKFLWIYGWLYIETFTHEHQKLHFCGRWVGTGADIGDSFSNRWCPELYLKREDVEQQPVSDWYQEK